MVGEPSRALPDVDFALGGRDFQGDTGRARLLGDVPFNVFPRAISAARVNLCITRRSHATVYASSSCRPFELAVVGRGDRREPVRRDRALVRARLASCSSSTTPTRRSTAYRELLDDPAQAEEMGRRARERVLDEHTYRHRARRLLELVGLRVGGACRLRLAAAGPASDAQLAALRRIAIVPAYNEELNIARVLDELRAFDPGSTSSSSPTARPTAPPRSPRPHGAHVVRLPFNLGIGGAVQTGFRYAWEEGYELAVARRRRRPARPGAARRRRRAGARGRGRHRVGSRFLGAGGYRSSAARRVGIRVLAWRRLGDRAPARDRHDLRLPGAEPPRDRASSPPTTRTTTPRSRGS